MDPGDVRRALTPRTKLISVMVANNETGVLQPVNAIGKIAQEADVYFHTDAVQAAGKIPLDVKAIGCDLLTISGHKMHAPLGTGALYVRRGTQIEPLFFGGLHERHRRAGTENLPGIVGLGKAADLAVAALEAGIPERTAALRDRLETRILATVDEAGDKRGRGAACLQHLEHLVRPCRGRGAGDCARSEGIGNFRRIGMPVGSHGAVSRDVGDGHVRGESTVVRSLQPDEVHKRRRYRVCRKPGARDSRSSARFVARYAKNVAVSADGGESHGGK